MWHPNGITFANESIVGVRPGAIFVNTNNTIYVANWKNNQILLWHEGSESPTKIVSGNFTYPNSIFVTSNGDIYIDDGDENRRVQKWISTNKTFATVMNVNSSCTGLFVDIKDNLYCSMSHRHRVVKRSLNDPVMTTAIVAGTGSEGSTSNELSRPYGIFVDVNLDLYVADWSNDRVQLFQREESNGTTVAGSESEYSTITLDCPSGISLDASKYLFIVDSFNARIVGSGPNGFRCLVGCYGKGSQSNQLFDPFSFSFDRSGNVFVVDQYNNRIQKFLYLEKSCGKLKKS
jgi:sugar lactone lactonase YvrE